MSYMKTTENILYCSLIPFEKLCLTTCTEKSFECFLNYFCFLFQERIIKVVWLVVELNTESIDYISSSLNLYILNIPLCHSPFQIIYNVIEYFSVFSLLPIFNLVYLYMQCYVLVAVLSLPCVTSLMATLSMETLCAFLRNKKQQKKKKNQK